MELIQSFFENVYNVEAIIRWGGLLVLIAIVFTETGLMVGFFLPGDSLLVTAGLFAAKGDLDIWVLNVTLSLAAIAGDTVGYWIGAKGGKHLFRKEKSFFFAKNHLLKTRAFYEKHGGKTIILARFMPFIRTFAPVVAGVGEMRYRRFLAYNIFGGIGWVASMTLIGFWLGRIIPEIDKHIHKVVAVVIFLSLIPGIVEIARARFRRPREEMSEETPKKGRPEFGA